MESFLATLKEQVKCSLCNETLNEPKLLPCFHVFCTSCIKGHLQLNDEQENIFHCPECNSETHLRQDQNEVEDLQVSPVHSRIVKVLEFIESQKVCSVSSSHPEALFQCLDCDRSLCEECFCYHSEFTKNHQVVSLSDLKEEDIEAMLKKAPSCKLHDNHIVESHCQDCDMLICSLCMKTHHHNHKTATLQWSLATEKELLDKILEDIDNIGGDEEEKKRQEEIALHIESEGEKAEKQVKELTEKLIKTLKNNEQQLLNKIHKSITKVRKNLRTIRHTTQAQEYIKYFLENSTLSEMIEARHGESSENFTYDPLDHTAPGVKFKVNDELCKQVEKGLGQVRTYLKKADRKMSSVNVKPSEIEAMKKTQLIINLKTSKGEDTDETLGNVKIHFTPNYVKQGEKQMTDNSTITIDFTPCVSGPLSATIALHGRSFIPNCRLDMSVKPQTMTLQTGNSKLNEALNTGSKNFSGIAVNKTNSKIAVADCKSNCIRVYNMEGDLLLTYVGVQGFNAQLKDPGGLAFLDETKLVVVDRGNNKILVCNLNTGSTAKVICDKKSVKNPYGVYVDDESNIIVCDYDNRIQVFTKDGDILHVFSVPRPFNAIKHNGKYYVTDQSTAVIREVGVQGNLSSTTISTIGGKNYTAGQIVKPCGLAIDNDSNLLLCDFDAKSIRKFTLDGRYVGHSTTLPNGPIYIAVLKDGQIICTTDNGVIFLEQ